MIKKTQEWYAVGIAIVLGIAVIAAAYIFVNAACNSGERQGIHGYGDEEHDESVRAADSSQGVHGDGNETSTIIHQESFDPWLLRVSIFGNISCLVFAEWRARRHGYTKGRKRRIKSEMVDFE